mgnify:CR=1 FL=1
MKTLNSIDEVEAYLGSLERETTESPLSIWAAKHMVLLMKRNQSLFEDSLSMISISDIGQGIVDMAQSEAKREKIQKLVCQLESYVFYTDNQKYYFDTKNYKPGTFYKIFAEIIIYKSKIGRASCRERV